MKKTVIQFLLLAFGISWLIFLIGQVFSSAFESVGMATFIKFLFMFGPAIAAIIMQKYVVKGTLKELGFVFSKMAFKNLLNVFFLYTGMAFLLCVLIYVFGNVSGMWGAGSIHFTPEQFIENIKIIVPEKAANAAFKKIEGMNGVLLFSMIFFSKVLIGGIVNTPLMLTEELGWRGFLCNQLQEKKFIHTVLFTGIVWGFWHAPLIVEGHNYPNHPIAGVFMMVLFCVSIAFPFHYFRKKTNSLLLPCFFHGIINASADAFSLFTKDADPLIGSLPGLLGCLSILVVFGIYLLIFDRKIFRKKPELI